MGEPAWTVPDFLNTSPANDDSYLSKLNAFLNANPPGGMATQALSSPEESNNSSPSSSSDAPTNLLSQANLATLANTTRAPAHAHDKRKPAAAAHASALKDRRGSSGSQENVHTHPSEEDDEGVTTGTTGKTTDRRRAQNRQAQRAFRERKEKHLKDLEDRVFSLEQTTTDQGSENNALKQLLAHLQSENERLKAFESAFSFSYDKDVSSSSSMPTSTQFGGKPPSPPLDPILPPLPPAQDLDSFTSSFGLFSPTTTAAFASVNANAASSALDDFSFFNSFAPSPASTHGGSTSDSSNALTTPPELGTTNFSSYRDGFASTAQFSELDAMFAASIPTAAHSILSSAALQSPVDGGAKLTSVAGGNPCAGPLGEKYEFDLDGLCSEMKAKASCQEAARQALQAAMKEDEAATNQLFPSQN